MPKFRVNLLKTVSYTIEVEADDEDAAIDAAYDQAPSVCAQCSGWGQDWGYDDGNDWQTAEDSHAEDYNAERHGPTVEPA
jgi:hypothetical protein